MQVDAKVYEEWVNDFVEKARALVTSKKGSTDLEKQNRSLKDLVSHYQKIIEDTVCTGQRRT